MRHDVFDRDCACEQCVVYRRMGVQVLVMSCTLSMLMLGVAVWAIRWAW